MGWGQGKRQIKNLVGNGRMVGDGGKKGKVRNYLWNTFKRFFIIQERGKQMLRECGHQRIYFFFS